MNKISLIHAVFSSDSQVPLVYIVSSDNKTTHADLMTAVNHTSPREMSIGTVFQDSGYRLNWQFDVK